jgi:hypothetical protein
MIMKTEEEILEMTDDQYIRYLFDSCENNVLTVVRYDEVNDPWHLKHTMDWTAADVNKLVDAFRSFRAALDRLAMAHDMLLRSNAPETLLTVEDFDIWNTYVRPLEGFDVPQETMQELFERNMANDLNEEEQDTLERYYDWATELCRQRLCGKFRDSYYLINRARRYERLVSLGAPQIILENEARTMAEEFVIFHHAIA